VHVLGPHVRAIVIDGDALRDVSWTPGDKIQILLSTLDVRTYTPSAWDARTGIAEIIAFEHGDSPGAVWSRRVAVGDACRFIGPQRSVRRGARPGVLFGDETSFGLAKALAKVGESLTCIFEVGSSVEAHDALSALGVSAMVVERTAGDAHLADVADAIHRALKPNAELIQTGRAQSIQALRPLLAGRGVRERGANKPYWAVGKVGLD
jgi:NADPH-dependent ferric siderophore reductase